ncbi:hypothetical protein M5J20_08510 [Corynebacterium sp. TA-R-1]|uniref:Porin n=1 Tax=Corynebacterium stercoris TaxID=2943490 RepID=A0ABT1G2G7_9CORY|nr:hypothetical protein [Corynebacterium stercoris]MCP1388223.1 hypothetical protein [Corynebacterium stercoris]
MTFKTAIDNWAALSSGDTITGGLLSALKVLGGLAENAHKLLGLLV